MWLSKNNVENAIIPPHGGWPNSHCNGGLKSAIDNVKAPLETAWMGSSCVRVSPAVSIPFVVPLPFQPH